MLKKFNILINNTSLTRKAISPFLRCSSLSYKFSEHTYKPLLPLTQNYNTLYIYPTYARNDTLRPHSMLIYMIPSALLIVNNVLTGWTVYNSVGLITLFLGTMFMRTKVRGSLSRIIHCIQTDPQLKYIYITVPVSLINAFIRSKYRLFHPQLYELQNNYHPVKQIYPNMKIGNDPTDFLEDISDKEGANNGMKIFRLFQKMQNKVIRFKIPSEFVNFKMIINSQEEPQFSRDKERLTQKQMMKKYQKQNIQVIINLLVNKPDGTVRQQKVVYSLIAPQNENKRYHDYILAMALGYKIDTSDNKKQQDVKYSQSGQFILDTAPELKQKQSKQAKDRKTMENDNKVKKQSKQTKKPNNEKN